MIPGGPGVPLLDVSRIATPVGEEPPPPPKRPKFPDIVQGILPAESTHILAGAQSAGKTAFTAWMLAEIMRTGQFLGHPAQLPSWIRVFVFDRGENDWEYWCAQAGIPCPKGYWMRRDRKLPSPHIRKWGKNPEGAIEHFRKKVIEMEPEPGGLLLTDGGIALLGAATIPYFEGYANMLECQRITADDLQLTHIPLCHAAKPKTRGSSNMKARDIDKVNMNAGALGSADTLCYLSCPDELSDGDTVPKYQRFTWVPHHAPSEEIYLDRTESGMFKRSLGPEQAAARGPKKTKVELERDERRIDQERARKYIPVILGEQPDKFLAAAKVAQILQSDRFGDKLSQTRAYETINAAKELRIAKAGEVGPDRRILYLIEVEKIEEGES